jgi:hypothetical protein
MLTCQNIFLIADKILFGFAYGLSAACVGFLTLRT